MNTTMTWHDPRSWMVEANRRQFPLGSPFIAVEAGEPGQQNTIFLCQWLCAGASLFTIFTQPGEDHCLIHMKNVLHRNIVFRELSPTELENIYGPHGPYGGTDSRLGCGGFGRLL